MTRRTKASGLHPEPVFRAPKGAGLAREGDGVGWMNSGNARAPVIVVDGVWVHPILAERFSKLSRAA